MFGAGVRRRRQRSERAPRRGPAPGAARGRSRRGGGVRILGLVAALAILGGGFAVSAPEPAEALPRGESLSLPGGITISNFVMPGGYRAYCIEVTMGEPSGAISPAGTLRYLPGRPGLFHNWEDPNGMRQMNYLIDTFGQRKDPWTAAAVQLTIWRMRENFRAGTNPSLDAKVATLNASGEGRRLIARSDELIADARQRATPPVAPKRVTGKLKIEKDPGGRAGRYRIAYPKGTTSLSATNATFVRNGAASLPVSPDTASARYVDVVAPGKRITASGSWQAQGQAGWEPELTIYNTATGAGAVGQRIAVATGKQAAKRITGSFAAVTVDTPPPAEPPTASSEAQPSADIGGMMTDALIVTARPGTTAEMWPSAVAEFTAYLEPAAGAPKFDDDWRPILGTAYEAQAEDPDTGALKWTVWWADASGAPLLDDSGNRIPTTDEHGDLTSGIAANGTAYPVAELDESGAAVLTPEGTPRYLTGRDPVMEERRDPLSWTAEELAAMTAAERCVAQPVARQDGIAVARPGTYRTEPVRVRSEGTVHWVERIVSNGKVVHQGRCGLDNETTRIGRPGVVTRATPEAMLGDELTDTATVSGRLAEGTAYALRFDAYRAESGAPACLPGNRLFRSEPVAVTAPGDYRSPGFTARWEHGEEIWWVETLLQDSGSGWEVLSVGECGLPNETTRVGRPAVETKALASAAVGDLLTDTATVSGPIAENAGARWELAFEGFRERYAPAVDRVDADPDAEIAVCDPENRLFLTDAVPVTGPGEVVSPPVAAEPAWAGNIWWVETLWLIEGDTRTAVSRGACGLQNETTVLTEPQVETESVEFAIVGDGISDTAVVTGALTERDGVSHELVFEGYRGDSELTGTDRAECAPEGRLFETEPVAVNGPGRVTSPPVTALPEFGDTIWWVETLRLREGDGVTELHRGACGLPNETTTVQFPSVRTEAVGAVAVGDDVFDAAFVDGPLSEREGISYRLAFAAYARGADGRMTCEPDTELRALSDPEGVVVDGPGRYESKRVRATAEHIGLGGFVETLTLIEGDVEHPVHRGDCGAEGESFEVHAPPAPPALAETGGPAALPILATAMLLVAGGTVAAVIAVRRRGGRGGRSVIHECPDLADPED